MIDIVMGPAGCGKTYHSKALKKHFNSKRIIDGWWPKDGTELKDGDLALTRWWPTEAELDQVPGQLHNFAQVMKEIKNKERQNVDELEVR